jgi:hypothetical protein
VKRDHFGSFKSFLVINKKLMVGMGLALTGIFMIQGLIWTSRSECLGIVDSKETMVAFETPVTVKQVFVLPGQIVTKGQPLVEVETTEVNMKILEVQTQIESLESEQDVRNTLLGSLSRKKKALSDKSPIAQEIAGLKRQLAELVRAHKDSVRYAESSGVVATVAYRPKEQVPPFNPIVTMTSGVPTLVYGFIHENRLADFKVGDLLQISAVAPPSRTTVGRVVSLGSRITPFPDRLQMVPGAGHNTYWGRELIVALASNNELLMGEKVEIKANPLPDAKASTLAFAATTEAGASEKQNSMLAEKLNLEASGMVYLGDSNSLLIVSDDDGPAQSPIWSFDIAKATARNLPLVSNEKIKDLESISFSLDHYYALGSLGRDGKAKFIEARSKMVRFQIQNDSVVVDRAIDFRTPLLKALSQLALLNPVQNKLKDVEVESVSFDDADAYLALKRPLLQDGSSVIL